MFPKWSQDWDRIQSWRICYWKLLILVTALLIAIPQVTHSSALSKGPIHIKGSPPILIKTLKGPDTSNSDKENFGAKQAETKKYYYAVKTPRDPQVPQEDTDVKMEGMESSQYVFGSEQPQFEELPQSVPEPVPYSMEYHTSEIRDQPINYEVAYDRGSSAQKMYEEQLRGAGASISHPYYGTTEAPAAAGRPFIQGPSKYLDYNDSPPPVLPHPVPDLRELPSGNNDYRTQAVGQRTFSRFKQQPFAGAGAFRPSQPDGTYETVPAPVPPGNTNLPDTSNDKVPGSGPSSSGKPNKYPQFHQQIIVNINNHREVEVEVPPARPPPNEQVPIDTTLTYPMQRPTNNLGLPPPIGATPNFLRLTGLPGAGTGNGAGPYGSILAPTRQLPLPTGQSGYGPVSVSGSVAGLGARFQPDRPGPGSPFTRNNMINEQRYRNIYRRSPVPLPVLVPVPVEQVGPTGNWRPVRSLINRRRHRRSASPYVSIADNSFPQSFTFPILSQGQGQGRPTDSDSDKAKGNFTANGVGHGHSHSHSHNLGIPSYAVLDSEFITLADFTGSEADFDLLLKKSTILLQELDKVTGNEMGKSSSSATTIVISSAASRKKDGVVVQHLPSGQWSNNQGPLIPIVNFQHTMDGSNGDYKVDFAAGQGINAKESGNLQSKVVSDSSDDKGINKGPGGVSGSSSDKMDVRVTENSSPNVKVGSVTWTSPEGHVFQLSYIADENGYRPTMLHTYNYSTSPSGASKDHKKAQVPPGLV